MQNKKKGFTLTELLAVIVVLVIIILIAIPIYGSIKKNVDKKQDKNVTELLKVAASKYAADTGITNVFVEELVEDGYVDKKLLKVEIGKDGDIQYKDSTGKIINCLGFHSEIKNGNYDTKQADEDPKEFTDKNGQCDKNMLLATYEVVYIVKTFTVNHEVITIPNDTTWTNTKVTLQPVLSSKYKGSDVDLAGAKIKAVAWYKGSNVIKSVAGNEPLVIDTDDDTILNEQYTAVVMYEIKDKNDGKVATTSNTTKQVVSNVRIDKKKPTFKKDDLINYGETPQLNDSWRTEYVYKPYLTTADEGSGLYGYYLEPGKSTCSSDKSKYASVLTKKEYKITKNGEYTTCILDNAGNITGSTKTLTKIDSTDVDKSGTCVIDIEGTKGNKVGDVQWYKGDSVTVRLTAKDITVGNSGLKLNISPGGVEKEYTEGTKNPSASLKIEESFSGEITGTILTGANSSTTCSVKLNFESSNSLPKPDKPATDPKSDPVKPTGTLRVVPDTIEILPHVSPIPKSGIKAWKAYYCITGKNCKPDKTKEISEAEVKKNNFKIAVDPQKETRYGVGKICYITNNGNEMCSDPFDIIIPGYCTQTTANTTNSNCTDCIDNKKNCDRKTTYNSKFKGFEKYTCGTSSASKEPQSCSPSKSSNACANNNYTEEKVRTTYLIYDFFNSYGSTSGSSDYTKIDMSDTTVARFADYHTSILEVYRYRSKSDKNKFCNGSSEDNNYRKVKVSKPNDGVKFEFDWPTNDSRSLLTATIEAAAKKYNTNGGTKGIYLYGRDWAQFMDVKSFVVDPHKTFEIYYHKAEYHDTHFCPTCTFRQVMFGSLASDNIWTSYVYLTDGDTGVSNGLYGVRHMYIDDDICGGENNRNASSGIFSYADTSKCKRK